MRTVEALWAFPISNTAKIPSFEAVHRRFIQRGINPTAVLTDGRHLNAQSPAHDAATFARTNQSNQGNLSCSEPILLIGKTNAATRRTGGLPNVR
jgi:hypothetical protein